MCFSNPPPSRASTHTHHVQMSKFLKDSAKGWGGKEFKGGITGRGGGGVAGLQCQVNKCGTQGSGQLYRSSAEAASTPEVASMR